MLSLLTADDQKRFTLFLDSPYFNNSPTLSLFWRQWETKVINTSSDAEVSEKEFVAGTPLKLSRIDALCWELAMKIRAFLTVEGTKNHPEIGVLLFSQSMLKRDTAMEVAHRFLPDLERELLEVPNTPEKGLAQLFHQDMILKAKIAARRSGTDWYAEFAGMNSILAQYYQVKNLQWGCGASNAGQVFREPQKTQIPSFLAEILQKPEPDGEAPIPLLFHLCLRLLRNSSDHGTLPRILDLLQREGNQIASPIRFEVYGYVLNHCIRHVNKGDESFLPSIFEIYRLLYPVGQPDQGQQIHPQQLKNVISIACRTGNLEWSLAFMKRYQPQLSELDRELALQFNTGVLAFYQKKYKSAIQIFQSITSIPTQDPFYGLDARIYLWKAYYESWGNLSATEADEMFRLYDSFRVFVDRNKKVSPSHQKQFRNLVRLFRRLMKCVEQPDPTKRRSSLLRFQKKLKREDYVANITWLLKKVEEALEKC